MANDQAATKATTDWYRILNLAAAKLAITAGASALLARTVSGFNRIDVKFNDRAIDRQLTTLTKAAIITGIELPPELDDIKQVKQQLIASNTPDTLAAVLLNVSRNAHIREVLELYWLDIKRLDSDLAKIIRDFHFYKEIFRQQEQSYTNATDRITQILKPFTDHEHAMRVNHIGKFSTEKFRLALRQLDQEIFERQSTTKMMADTSRTLSAVMEKYQRHHAQRAFYRSKSKADFRNYSLFHVPKSTLYDMKCSEFAFKPTPYTDSKMIDLAEKWHRTCQEFSIAHREMLQQHDHEYREVMLLRNRLIAAR
ncbi:Uncharacterised protein [Mycobacteroides abscessus subsp. massiliense]|uniref:hypothetical protein n=1 Tax=Mycobacteroides abscessus TaxID=36809 RepID=UPI0009CE2671|nr:hypothetical protein [Mycobacteroides abscessus]SKG00975.1 Uncharacterised protein [Mycobacteroides abscessus subsp. massiliense]SKG29091.1 Uncharacterised protein [Mycobacteroides abscessus subsp. massiliense]SKH68910.1 Uncharacterised protein [Mycobacteroides abscessus subsp. massiliense]SKI50765.1 Uncharacterised protein [Mycobacteroides abscessus subsp. massiliense]